MQNKKIIFLKEFVSIMQDFWYKTLNGQYDFWAWFCFNFPEIPFYDLSEAGYLAIW